SILHAVSTAGVAFAPNTWVAAPAMFAGGMGWIVVANSVTVAAQLALPDWVRARGMSIYQMAIMGGSALGAAIWGKLADLTSVPDSLAFAAVSMLIALVATWKRTLEGSEDHTPTHPFEEPVPARPIDLDEGPVMCTVEYFIDPTRAAEFDAVMSETRGSRLRAGAVSWGIFEDLERPGSFVGCCACDSGAGDLRRFDPLSSAAVT